MVREKKDAGSGRSDDSRERNRRRPQQHPSCPLLRSRPSSRRDEEPHATEASSANLPSSNAHSPKSTPFTLDRNIPRSREDSRQAPEGMATHQSIGVSRTKSRQYHAAAGPNTSQHGPEVTQGAANTLAAMNAPVPMAAGLSRSSQSANTRRQNLEQEKSLEAGQFIANGAHTGSSGKRRPKVTSLSQLSRLDDSSAPSSQSSGMASPPSRITAGAGSSRTDQLLPDQTPSKTQLEPGAQISGTRQQAVGASASQRCEHAAAGPPPSATPNVADSVRPTGAIDHKYSMRVVTTVGLVPLERKHHIRDPKDFVRVLADEYNAEVPPVQHQMKLSLHEENNKPADETMWCLSVDQCPSGVYRLTSPILDVSPPSPWRHHVRPLWQYLHRNFEIDETQPSQSYVQIWTTPGLNPSEFRALAASIIHFEPGFEALLDETWPSYASGQIEGPKSHWLNSPYLARAGLTRPQAISALQRAPFPAEVVRLMQGTDPNHLYAWDLRPSLLLHPLPKNNSNYIEYHKLPSLASYTAAATWPSVIVRFVKAAVARSVLPGELGRYPSTYGGLNVFMRPLEGEGGHESSSRALAWARIANDPRRDLALAPRRQSQDEFLWDPREECRLRTLVQEDLRAVRGRASAR